MSEGGGEYYSIGRIVMEGGAVMCSEQCSAVQCIGEQSSEGSTVRTVEGVCSGGAVQCRKAVGAFCGVGTVQCRHVEV